MSKTYVYLLVLIGVYLLIVKGIKIDSTAHSGGSGRSGKIDSNSNSTSNSGGSGRSGKF